MTDQQLGADHYMLALCLWREDRGGLEAGMTAVGCCIRNRLVRDKSSYYEEIIKRLQFSSITAPRDPELNLYPNNNDTLWHLAWLIAGKIIDGTMEDTTGGATLYYATSIPFPATWNRAKVDETVTIGGQVFYTERA